MIDRWILASGVQRAVLAAALAFVPAATLGAAPPASLDPAAIEPGTIEPAVDIAADGWTPAMAVAVRDTRDRAATPVVTAAAPAAAASARPVQPAAESGAGLLAVIAIGTILVAAAAGVALMTTAHRTPGRSR